MQAESFVTSGGFVCKTANVLIFPNLVSARAMAGTMSVMKVSKGFMVGRGLVAEGVIY